MAGRELFVGRADLSVRQSIAQATANSGRRQAHAFATGVSPYSITVDPPGQVAYVTHLANATGTAGSISAFTINSSTGVLSPVAGNPLAIPVSNYISIDPQGKFLFVTEAVGVAVYPVNTSTGVLGTTAGGWPFAAGTSPYSVRIDPTGQFVYIGNDGSGNVSEFTLSSTGTLTPIAGMSTGC